MRFYAYHTYIKYYCVKKPTLYNSCEEPTKSALKSVENSIFVFCYFLRFVVLLFLIAFVSALKTPFGAFKSCFYGLGSTVSHKKYSPFNTQKLPNNREFLAWNLYCIIDMELVTGFEPATEDCF